MATITSAGNAAVKAARKLSRRQARERADAFLVEGPAAVSEALGSLVRLFVADAADASVVRLADRARRRGVEVLDVTDTVMAGLAGTVTPQGVVGVATLPRPALDSVLGGARLVVVLSRVSDPGNLGTIIRTADAAGADAVVLAGSSVDPRNPKAVRASAGSLFHLPVLDGLSFADVVAGCRRHGLRLVAADAQGEQVHTELDLLHPVAFVLGSEAHGLDEAVLASCDVVARIPISDAPRPGYGGRAESLNLAASAAVLLYEAARQRGFADPPSGSRDSRPSQDPRGYGDPHDRRNLGARGSAPHEVTT